LLALVLQAAEPSKPPVFEIRLVLDKPALDSEQMTCAPRKPGEVAEVLNVQRTPLIDQKALKSACVQSEPASGLPYVQLTFTEQGAKRFAEVTAQNIHKRLAIVIDGKLFSAPMVESQITGGSAQITGNFSQKEATDLAAKLNDAAKE
jgi:preprotein translocase subunit SecD